MSFALFMIALAGCAGSVELGGSLIIPIILLILSLVWLFRDYAKWLQENE